MTTGVLAMADGTPRDVDDIERYYTDIRHGRPPSNEQLRELTDRYVAIGGKSPLLEITQRQAAGIAQRVGQPTYVGQKHSAPFIHDAVRQMKDDGVERAVALVLAPHFSTMSVGDYVRRIRAAAEQLGWTGQIETIKQWHLEPGYVQLLARYCKEALGALSSDALENTTLVFTAHSLPAAIVRAGDPYPQQLEETAGAVAETLGYDRWRTAWQSAGRNEAEWLGPDVLEVIEELASNDGRGVIVCPCGFVADHLEVLYDVDIEAADRAKDLGIEFARTRSPNDDPDFLDTLGEIVRRALPPA